MDNQERTILVDAKIVDNFVEASKNVAIWRKEMKLAQEQGKDYQGEYPSVIANKIVGGRP